MAVGVGVAVDVAVGVAVEVGVGVGVPVGVGVAVGVGSNLMVVNSKAISQEFFPESIIGSPDSNSFSVVGSVGEKMRMAASL